MKKGLFDLSDKVAVVTGGGGRLGRAFCEAMAEYGADVVVSYNSNEDAAQEVAGLVKKFGRRSLAVKADVSNPDDVTHLIAHVVKELGRVDILFNNAGVTMKPAKTHQVSIEEWDKVLTVDLRGAFLCMRAVLPIMMSQGKGNIINVSSSHALQAANPEILPRPAYTAAKAGLISLTREVAIEYVKNGIRVNCIVPGYHGAGLYGRTLREVEATKGSQEKERMERLDERLISCIPMGRKGEPDELKGLAVYLASDASSFVTGQIFIQDGGESLGATILY